MMPEKFLILYKKKVNEFKEVNNISFLSTQESEMHELLIKLCGYFYPSDYPYLNKCRGIIKNLHLTIDKFFKKNRLRLNTHKNNKGEFFTSDTVKDLTKQVKEAYEEFLVEINSLLGKSYGISGIIELKQDSQQNDKENIVETLKSKNERLRKLAEEALEAITKEYFLDINFKEMFKLVSDIYHQYCKVSKINTLVFAFSDLEKENGKLQSRCLCPKPCSCKDNPDLFELCRLYLVFSNGMELILKNKDNFK